MVNEPTVLPEVGRVEPAVTTVLAEVLSQPTAWGDLGDWCILPGCQANRKPALGLQVSPIAGGTLPAAGTGEELNETPVGFTPAKIGGKT